MRCLKMNNMYYRRKILLNLIAGFGDKGISRIKLQKLLFVFCQKHDAKLFDFVPYKYGCFSFQANKDLLVLADHYQFIKDGNTRWFAQTSPPELKPREENLVRQLVGEFQSCDNAQMIDYVYEKYPYFSIYSEWNMTARQRRLAEKEKTRIQAKTEPILFTIGYEGKSIDAYLNELVRNNIRLLCDVRKNPLSMKYGFSKTRLKTYCEDLNIIYVHIPGLGIDSRKRKHLKNKRDYQVLFTIYRNELPTKADDIDRVLNLFNQYKRMALTCFEKYPQECHRHCVSDYLQTAHEVKCEHL